MEAKTIGLRVSASQKHLRRVGRFPGGVVPYGHRTVPHLDGTGRALEPDPAEAAVVRRAADEVLGGASVYATCARPNADGIKQRRAEQLGPTALQRLLRSNHVLGRVKARGELLRDPDTGLPLVFWDPILPVADVEALRRITNWKPTPAACGGDTHRPQHEGDPSPLGTSTLPGLQRPLDREDAPLVDREERLHLPRLRPGPRLPARCRRRVLPRRGRDRAALPPCGRSLRVRRGTDHRPRRRAPRSDRRVNPRHDRRSRALAPTASLKT